MIQGFPYSFYEQSAKAILDKLQADQRPQPRIGIILGSGLDHLGRRCENPLEISYREIPNFFPTTNSMHAGKMIFGTISGVPVVLLSGRIHHYEGYSFEELAQPVRVLKLLGVETLIVTNAAGAVNPDFKVGQIMMMTDQIKLFGGSPLQGPNVEEFGPRFPDMTDLFTPSLREKAWEVAESIGLDHFCEGVYFYLPGPQFETPAEIKAVGILGGDAVGMSTVNETITARHCGMSLLGFSLLTNLATGLSPYPLSDQEVVETARKAASYFEEFILALLPALATKE